MNFLSAYLIASLNYVWFAQIYELQSMYSSADFDFISEEYVSELTQALKDTDFDFSQINAGAQEQLTIEMLQDPKNVAKVCILLIVYGLMI